MDANLGPTISLITESYNFESGQSIEALERALRAAVEAVSGVVGGPHEVLLIDCSSDPRTREAVSRVSVPVPHNLRHVQVPSSTSYDTIKDLGAVLAHGQVVAYLDGDCTPRHSAGKWLSALVDELVASGAPGVGGVTMYEGRSALSLASSALDFGFLFDRPDGSLHCYTSNNVCFWRDHRAPEPMSEPGLRCNCYLHAQSFVRRGTPMFRATAPEALLFHELPPVLDERFRRGYDAVIVARKDDDVHEARSFAGSRFRASTFGVLHFVASHWRTDSIRCKRVCRLLEVSPGRSLRARIMAHMLRGLEVVGMWRAIWRPPDPRWTHEVSLEQVLEYLRDTETSRT